MVQRVLVSDKLAEQGLAILDAEAGIELDNRPGIGEEELAASIAGYHALIVRSGTRVTAEVIDAAAALKVIGRAGIGVDNVDVAAASMRGVVVMNTPTGNNVTTAEHALSMLLALARHIPQACASLRKGEWKRGDFVGTELCNKTLGIVGIGNIGSIVANRAAGLKMKVLAYDPYITAQSAARLGLELVSLEELYARSDFISVHTPLTAETEGMVDAGAFAAMKDGVHIVNCARGGIVDEQALAEAITAGKVAGAALDVFAKEPPPADSPLLAMPQVVATPHLGASTGEAQLNVAIAIAEQVRDFLCDGVISNAVNVPSVPPEAIEALMPYIILAERIGSLHAQLAARIPDEVTIAYQGEAADLDCRSVNAAVLQGLLAKVMESPVNSVNAPILARERGIKVVEMREHDVSSFASAIEVTFRGADGDNIIAGAVFGGNIVRLVRFDDFFLEAVPEGIILILHNRDVPGVVGRVGTFLAEHSINIAGLELGRVGGEAVSFVHIDSPLSSGQIEELRSLPDITAAAMVRLD